MQRNPYVTSTISSSVVNFLVAELDSLLPFGSGVVEIKVFHPQSLQSNTVNSVITHRIWLSFDNV